VKDPLKKIKPQVRALSAYHLKPYDCAIKLNQNENPYDLPAEIKEEVLSFARTRPWCRYPAFVPDDLIATFAEHYGWTREGILVGNGSNELILATLMVTLGPGARVLIPVPTFTLYKLESTVMGAEVATVHLGPDYTFDLDALRLAIREQMADLVVICSPNNPTGCILENDDLEAILKETDALVAVDEAYHEFCDRPSCVGLLSRHPNLIVLRTFSKAMAMAGLRVGCLLAHPDLAREIGKAKLPYNLNFFSHAAATVAIKHRATLRERIDHLRGQRDFVYRNLREIRGVRPYPSHANFILFEVEDPKRVFDGLAARGILIRDVSHYPMLSKALRVSVGTDEENETFLKALKEVMVSCSPPSLQGRGPGG